MSSSSFSLLDKTLHDSNELFTLLARDKDLQGFDLRVCLFIGIGSYRTYAELLSLSGAKRPNLSRSLHKLMSKGYVIRSKIDEHQIGYRLPFDEYDRVTKGGTVDVSLYSIWKDHHPDM